eukprot:TRINITY_DN299_c0_g1_i13.p2 TRINITY_DN299_c0_g1~~TRINITY_DN299_c0_g1_i13.p2  ORF type:complete len:104 (+),score=4.11 TRINITY_DN299_c0_g1_i13:271-582(+)
MTVIFEVITKNIQPVCGNTLEKLPPLASAAQSPIILSGHLSQEANTHIFCAASSSCPIQPLPPLLCKPSTRHFAARTKFNDDRPCCVLHVRLLIVLRTMLIPP